MGCLAAFFGASQLASHRFLDPIVIVPLLGGLAAIVILVVYQYRARRPLLTVRTMLTSTIPVAGISVALFAAAASVSAMVLTAAALTGVYSPLHIGQGPGEPRLHRLVLDVEVHAAQAGGLDAPQLARRQEG